MGRHLVSRLLQSLLVLFGVLTVVFGLLHLTGDPARMMLPLEASEREVAEMRRHLGTDQPLLVQYARFMSGALQGDFGTSLRHRQQPAVGLVLERIPATIELTLAAMLFSIVLAIPLGIMAARWRGSVRDRSVMALALFGQSVPNFWLGIMLILVFAVTLDWLPPFGRGGLEHVVLPAATLGAFTLARTSRLVRSGLLDVLSQDYIRTARAKGLLESQVLVRHALKNASIPIVTILGLDFAHLLGGAVVTEVIFAWPGIGRLAVEAVYSRDFPVVQAVVFFIAVGFVVINFLVDVLYTYLDPRVRFSG